MSALEASEQLLRQVGEPLHYKEITKQILDSGTRSTEGLTPEATVIALISTDIKRRGASSVFRRTAPGVYTINEDRQSASETEDEVQEDPDTLTFLDAAEYVFTEYADGQPMHYRDITSRALELGVLSTKGRTPEATMYAQVITDVNKAQASGGVSRFTKLGKDMVGLTAWKALGSATRFRPTTTRSRKCCLPGCTRSNQASSSSSRSRYLPKWGSKSSK